MRTNLPILVTTNFHHFGKPKKAGWKMSIKGIVVIPKIFQLLQTFNVRKASCQFVIGNVKHSQFSQSLNFIRHRTKQAVALQLQTLQSVEVHPRRWNLRMKLIVIQPEVLQRLSNGWTRYQRRFGLIGGSRFIVRNYFRLYGGQLSVQSIPGQIQNP